VGHAAAPLVALRHGAVGRPHRGAAPDADLPRGLQRGPHRPVVRDDPHADAAAVLLRPRPAHPAHPVRAHRDRRRVPPLDHVREDDRALRRAGLRAQGPHPQPRPAVQDDRLRPCDVRGHPVRRGDPGPVPARVDARRLCPAALPDGQQDPRDRGGPARPLRQGGAGTDHARDQPRGARRRSVPLGPHRPRRGHQPHPPGRLQERGHRPEGRAQGRVEQPHWQETLRWSARKLVPFLREQKIIGGPMEFLWRKAYLV